MATRASARLVKCAFAQNRRFIPSLSQLSLRSYSSICASSWDSSSFLSTNGDFSQITKNGVKKKPDERYFIQCRSKSTLTSKYDIKKHSSANVKVIHSLRNTNLNSAKSSVLEDNEQDEYDDDDGHDGAMSENYDAEGAFDKLGISELVQNKLRARGINYLFPVQYKAYEQSVAGKDMIIQARTGTGKTLSFSIPLVEKLIKEGVHKGRRNPKVLVLTPTRELANQIKEDFEKLSDNVTVLGVYGGVPYYSQIAALNQGRDVVVGTPGRTNDLIQKGNLNLADVEHVVLDEVDTMLDFGFKETVEDIIKGCYQKEIKPQTMLYSATISPWVITTAKRYLSKDYQFLNFVSDAGQKTSTTIEQYAMQCPVELREVMILNLLEKFGGTDGRAIVFTEMKREAEKLSSGLLRNISESLHGDKSQQHREKVLKGFKNHDFKVLITTSVAARGLDIPDVPIVIQTSPPNDTDHYIHRVGRTGRAGKAGVAICFYQPGMEREIRTLERAAKVKMTRLEKPSQKILGATVVQLALNKIEAIPSSMIEEYREAANKLIEEKGATEAMATALAALGGGQDNVPNFSLLNGKTGLKTVQYSWGADMKPIVMIKSELREILGQDAVTHLEYVQDENAVVFDVESSSVTTVIKQLEESTGKGCIQVLSALPKLRLSRMMRDSSSGSDNTFRSNRYSNSSSRYGDDSRGGRYGESRGGFGDRRGGFDRRGGYGERRGGFSERRGGYGENRGGYGGNRGGYGGDRNFGQTRGGDSDRDTFSRSSSSNPREFKRSPFSSSSGGSYDIDYDSD